ncbi:MAG: hypothetical protein ACREMU_02150 [Gemmatimonadaceae bacterium]
MSRRKKTVRAEQDVPRADSEAPAPTGIHLQAVLLRLLTYREIPTDVPVAAGHPAPPQMAVGIKLTGQVRLHPIPDGPVPGVEFVVKGIVKPDIALRPIEVEVELSLVVAPATPAEPSVTLTDVVKFLSVGGLRTTYPYLREIISSVTARGIYGPLFLDPVFAQPLMSDEQIDQIVKSYEAVRTRTAAAVR